MPNSLAEHIDAAVRDRGPQPFLTFYDATTGARTELSYATLHNWASKTANWLIEERAAARGEVVEIDVADDWRTFAAVTACWKLGAAAGIFDNGAGITAADDVLVFADDYDDPDVDDADPALHSGDGAWTQSQLVDAAPELPGRARIATNLPADRPLLWQLAVGALLARGAIVWSPGADEQMLRRHAENERAGYLLTPTGLSER